jgi:hypothetical protein
VVVAATPLQLGGGGALLARVVVRKSLLEVMTVCGG